MDFKPDEGMLTGFVIVLVCAVVAVGAAGLRVFMPLLHQPERASDEVTL
jgi:hypothetical protein